MIDVAVPVLLSLISTTIISQALNLPYAASEEIKIVSCCASRTQMTSSNSRSWQLPGVSR